MMNKPLGTQVRIKPDPAEEITPSGIILPSKEIPTTGVVLELSPDYEFSFKVGDRVRFTPNHRLELEDGSWLINGHDDDGVIYFVFNN